MGIEDLAVAIEEFKKLGISPDLTDIYSAHDGILFVTLDEQYKYWYSTRSITIIERFNKWR